MQTAPIVIDGLLSPGYVSLHCETYGLPDNTMGQIGYHVVYRPLALHPNGTPQYQGNDLLTDAMRDDIKAVVAQKAREAEAATQQREAETAARRATWLQHPPRPLHRRPGLTTPCPSCGTYCAGDCQAR